MIFAKSFLNSALNNKVTKCHCCFSILKGISKPSIPNCVSQLWRRTVNTNRYRDNEQTEFILQLVRSQYREKKLCEEVFFEDYLSLAQNEEEETLIKLIVAEYNFMKYTDALVPKKLKVADVQALMNMKNGMERVYYLKDKSMRQARIASRDSRPYLNHFKELLNEKEENKTSFYESIFENVQPPWIKDLPEEKTIFDSQTKEIVYGKCRNSLTLPIYGRFVSKRKLKSLSPTLRFAQNLVIDFGYEEYLKPKELRAIGFNIRQMCFTNAAFRDQGFKITYCNVEEESRTEKYINCTFTNDIFEMTTKSYLDLFPIEKLIYLSWHANEELKEWDHDTVFILPAMSYRVNKGFATFYKPLNEGIKVRKIPLEAKYFNIGPRISLLPAHILSILYKFRETSNWKLALRESIPQRLYKKEGVIIIENLRNKKSPSVDEIKFEHCF